MNRKTYSYQQATGVSCTVTGITCAVAGMLCTPTGGSCTLAGTLCTEDGYWCAVAGKSCTGSLPARPTAATGRQPYPHPLTPYDLNKVYNQLFSDPTSEA